MNKKGFTLIELLAVIIILGILMIIAIPSVTRYISDSRKAAYIDTAKQVASATKYLVNSGKLEMYDTSVAYYIPNTCIKVENGNKAKSPYGEFIDDRTYVVVTYDGKGYSYYWVSLDDTGTGVKEPISIDKLEEKDIETDLTRDDVKDNNGVGKEKVVIFSSTCDGKTEKDAFLNNATTMILDSKTSQLVKIDDDVYIFKGSNPDNYVRFNCDSNNNCETWRIIGLYGNNIKIQNTVSIGKKYYYYSWQNDGTWENSSLQNYLNTTYYESLNESAKNMITDGSWNVGIVNQNFDAITAYNNSKTVKLVRKVGLIASYEYLYGSDGDDCSIKIGTINHYNIMCGTLEHNWLTPSSYSWTLSPYNRQYGVSIRNEGCIYSVDVQSVLSVFPSVVIDSSIKITGGSGTNSDPYTLGL